MCGRFALYATPEQLIDYFGLDECADLTPRYNIPPGTDIAAIRQSPEGKRVLHLLRWGLVPHWAKDPSLGNKLNNARGESVAEKPSFREAFKRRRCLIPANGFYEWKTGGKAKQPYYISLKAREPITMAGLWESWQGPDGKLLRTCCVVTTGANAVMARIHDRMPVILGEADWADWLDPAVPAEAARTMLGPCPDDWIRTYPVSRAVSAVRNEGVELIEPIEENP